MKGARKKNKQTKLGPGPGSILRTTGPCFNRTPGDWQQQEEEEAMKPLFVPYVRGLSERLEKGLYSTGGQAHIQTPEYS